MILGVFFINKKLNFVEADFVIITISTDGLDAMSYDLSIPEDYKIYQTVGGSVGPEVGSGAFIIFQYLWRWQKILKGTLRMQLC